MNIQNNVNDIFRNIAYLKSLGNREKERQKLEEKEKAVSAQNERLIKSNDDLTKANNALKQVLTYSNNPKNSISPYMVKMSNSKDKISKAYGAKDAIKLAFDQYTQSKEFRYFNNIENKISKEIDRSNFNQEVKEKAREMFRNPAAGLKPFELKKTKEGLPIIENPEKEGDTNGINK